jgi:site-specific recombinase XerD
MTKNSRYPIAMSSFLEKLRAEDGLSANTISSYGKDLELFARFFFSHDFSGRRSSVKTA